MKDGLLKTLVENSYKAIDQGVYKISDSLPKSEINLIDSIKNNRHASLIAEVKFASPSLGQIRQKTDPLKIATSMVNGGAVALSVLTQPYMFSGSPKYFIQIRNQVRVPMLMKDIIVDRQQIDAAKKMGADYILLIQSLFDQNYLKEIEGFIKYAHNLGLQVLVEAHTKTEFKNSLESGADLVGINNRNLDTLKVDINTTKKILEGFAKTRLIVSESGIESADDIRFLRQCGADAFLVGSGIMKHENIQERVRSLVLAI